MLQSQVNLWKERFFYLYEKYDIFYEDFEGLGKEASFLTDQFLNVQEEEEWVALKEKYDSLVERMAEVKDKNASILQEIQ